MHHLLLAAGSGRMTRALSLRAGWALLVAAACGGDGGNVTPNDPGAQPADSSFTSTGSIAYARGGEIRLVEPDGSADHNIWTAPGGLGFSVSGIGWKPNGGALAFSSDHEMATSFYERDIYTVKPDGNGLRKLTNGPSHAELGGYPQGTVEVTVQNNTTDGGPYVIYAVGAAEPQSELIAPGSSKTLTFSNVADLGSFVQPVVAINGGIRWIGAAADVAAGNTRDAGLLVITPSGGLEHFGAAGPTWRSDGADVGFISGAATCTLEKIAPAPSAGQLGDPLLAPDRSGAFCAFDRSPLPAQATQVLVAETDFSAGQGHVYRMTEGSGDRGAPLVTYPDYVQILDLRWLPDGSGFLFAAARYEDVIDESSNLYEYTFAGGGVRKITGLANEYVRGFSISPDGQRVVFERTTDLSGRSDLWIVQRDGSGLRLLVSDGSSPAWNPTRP
jgi:dipeptidyl aminopeptidase/acylaminoacyl peptidase